MTSGRNERRHNQPVRRRLRSGYASDGFLDGGSATGWWAREFGNQFDGILQITVKPFSHGKDRAFDPADLGDA